MAVTREQIAQWSKDFDAKNPGTSAAQSTAKKKGSVSREQIDQWSKNFEQEEQEKKRQAADNIQSKALQQYTERHASDIGEVDARNEPSQSLLRNASSPKGGAIGRPGNSALTAEGATGRKVAGLATEASSAFDMSRKWGAAVQPNVLEDVGGGAMAYGSGTAQALKASYAPYSTPDEFDRIDQWLDTGDNRNLADSVRRVDEAGIYSDADLIKAGWTQEQIKTARQMNAAMDAIPGWKKATRRASNTIGGTADVVASAPLLGAEYGVQSAKNIAATQQNWEKVRQEIKGDERAQSLFDLLTDVDMDYNPTWPKSRNRELISMGYNSKEIQEMRDRLAGLEVTDGIDKNQSVGYQLYDRGQDLLGAAQSGLTPMQKAVSGVVTSAAENLAVAAIDPAAVLPVLSAQGAADAMGQSAAKGESAGKALGGGLAKFGAGWAINSVGAADLAKTMGSDYAKDTLAGQIADWVQGIAGSSDFAKAHPAVASAISGGMDNAMQAFVETYADKAIDAALGDSEAAESLFSKDTFVAALESGLSGGASGAMGGAVGSGLARMNGGNASWRAAADDSARGETPQAMPDSAAKSPDGEDLTPQSAAPTAPLSGEPLAEKPLTASVSPAASALPSSPDRGAENQGKPLATAERVEETAVNDDPAVHTAQQNASITEYKESVDPKMAEYVDKVRAGEKLAPYTVAKTSDRTRSAMMELTGLAKVGDVTMLDANGVNHITNRHGGGDGSADGTMKESADVARAAYVLNNFDNAYLAKDKAKGYKDSRGKRAPIVIFEKKIDGSHIVVEAACDTKKGQNFIVTEYLSSVGVDQNEVVKALQAPMDAASDPRHTSETFSAHSSTTAEELQSSMDATSDPRDTSETLAELPSAKTSIAEEGRDVNGPMRETAGLREQTPMSQRQAEVRRALESWKVTDKAAQTISKNMPENVDTELYAAAASPLYRLGRAGAESFEQALELAGSTSGAAADINYIMSTDTGKTALKIAYLQGKGEAMLYAEKMAELGGALSDKSTSGNGRVLYKGTMRDTDGAAGQIISLNAAATGTDAVLKDVLNNDRNVKAYVDSETAKIYFGDSAEDVFGTVLHEDWHWYNALDAEGARTLQEHVLEYLAKNSGYESIDEMIRNKVQDYGTQSLTYEQAAEELVADAWRGIFDSEESFKRWVEFQRGQAEKNAGKAGTIRRVMEKVRQMLDGLISKAKEVLAIDPDNRAARKAQRLAEAEKRTLQDEYFAHAEKAMDALRTAKENAAALRTESAAEKRGVRFKLHEGKDSLVEQMNQNIEQLEKMKTVAVINGTEVMFGVNRKENIENITEYFDSIENQVVRNGFGTVELTAKGARTTIQHGNSAAKQAAVASIPEVIKNGKPIGYEKNWQGRGYDTYVFAAPVEIDGVKLYEGAIVNSYLHDGRKVFYVHEVCWTDGSYVTLNDHGTPIKKEDISTSLPKAMLNALTDGQETSSDSIIPQTTGESKENNTPAKKQEVNQ